MLRIKLSKGEGDCILGVFGPMEFRSHVGAVIRLGVLRAHVEGQFHIGVVWALEPGHIPQHRDKGDACILLSMKEGWGSESAYTPPL